MSELEKIDLIRERMNISYEKARDILESANGDVVGALISMEKDERGFREEFIVRGNELVDKIKELAHKGNVAKIKVKQDEKVLVEIPVTAGVVGALLAPQLAVIGAIATLVSRCTVEIERETSDEVVEVVRETVT